MEVTVYQAVLSAAVFGSNICAVTLHLNGVAAPGIEARAAVHFETPEAGVFTAPVTNQSVLQLLG